MGNIKLGCGFKGCASFALVAVGLAASQIGLAVELHFESSSPTLIEDAVLFSSNAGTCDYATVAIGDIDLSRTDFNYDLNLAASVNSAWLVGRINSDIVFTSNDILDGFGLFDLDTFDFSNASFQWTEADVAAELGAFVDKTVLVRIGVMADTHYYRNPAGVPHPLEQIDPVKYDLTSNLGKMQLAWDDFIEQEADFAVILGDMVEDHAGWVEGSTWPAYGGFIADGALNSNLGDIGGLFDQYTLPVHLVIGNHDTGFGTTRTELYNTLSYYGQETYDDNAYATRMDYTFDVNGVRFVAFDNVGQIPVAGALQGYRWASDGTLQFLTDELAKVSVGGIDEGMPIVFMSHARVDCLPLNNCHQKVALIDASKYQWTASVAGIDEYYLEAVGGGFPEITHTSEYYNQFIWLAGSPLRISSVGELVANSWDYGSNPADNLAFNTIYIRLADPFVSSYDPDDAPTVDYVQYKYVEPGMSENFEETRAILEGGAANGANILAVFQGHHHISAKNIVGGIQYYTFSSPKTKPEAHAIVDILYDGSIYIDGYGFQTTYNLRKPYHEFYDCLSSQTEIRGELWDQMVKKSSQHSVDEGHDFPMIPAWRFGPTAQPINRIGFDLHSSATVYESAQDGSANRWQIYDNDPAGAVISNVFDADRQSRVIDFLGASWQNGYVLRNDALEQWRDAAKSVIQWSMKFSETYFVKVKVKTNRGTRYLRYTAVDYDELGDQLTIHYGLGSETQDGQWHTFVRDLKQDLELGQPGVKLIEVNEFHIQGSGRVDDVKLHSSSPPQDTDGDGISDALENTSYFTDATRFDTDGDGIGDGSELIFWGSDWDKDSDGDGQVNLLDPDSDGDGVGDGVELNEGSDPADPASVPPPVIYEDAEDVGVSRWVVYDNVPAGAVISNVFDLARQSQVIDFSGSSWKNMYALKNDELQEWNDSTKSIIQWSMKFSEIYMVNVKVKTDRGNRYLRYTAVDYDGLGAGVSVNFGLGSHTQDGRWRTYVRDLQKDLDRAQPGLKILEVNVVFVQGSGRVDDVILHSVLPPADTDGDGIPDDVEFSVYATDPVLFDTDGDGISDGEEIVFWGNNWNRNNDGDGLYNLLDFDSDNDGVSDGIEREAGSDPEDSGSAPPPIVYEDGEDGLTNRWQINDNDPVGSVISNVFDVRRQSQVIDFNGASWTNGYVLRNSNLTEWGDNSGSIVEWSMKYSEIYMINIKVNTDQGVRYLRYTSVDYDGLGAGVSINFGLGSGTQDGHWRTYVRDLQQDLSLAQPGVNILEVNAFFMQGSGRVDDVRLHSILPPADTDGDGVSDAEEIAIYMTDPSLFDTDGDGLSDGEELTYWGINWSQNGDADSLINLLDPDSDNDGVSDGAELDAGSDPADANSGPPPTIYEDSEDGSVGRWEIYDNVPAGAVVSNVFDAGRQSQVIDFSGASWTNGYVLRNSDLKEWRDGSGNILEWSMNYAETYIITVKVMTVAGARYLRYTAVDSNGLGTAATVNLGLGSGTRDGQWRTYIQDLQQDLALAQPGLEILEVNAFFVQGTGRVDDVKLHSVAP